MPWPVYLALKQLFPTGRVSFFTLMAVVGVTIGVMVLIVLRSVMGGFGYQIQRMIIDTQGEIQIVAAAPIDEAQAQQVEKALAAQPEVQSFAGRAVGMVMVQHENHPSFPIVQGFELEPMRKVIPLDRYLVGGSFDDLDDDSVILSVILARQLNARVGDTVELYSPLMLNQLKRNEVPLPREARVAGIFQVGHQQLDSSTVLCSLRLMQDLYGLRNRVHGYNVRLKPGANEFRVAAQLNQHLPAGTQAMSWFESNADFQAVLSFENNMVTLVLSLIVVVAAFAITMALVSTVVRKTREIGLIVAMGGLPRGVAGSFCLQGFFVGFFGAWLGLGAALLILHFRDNIVRVLTKLTMGQDTFEQFYQFNHLPSHTKPVEVVVIMVLSIVAATLAGLLPALRAARLKPVEALRSE